MPGEAVQKGNSMLQPAGSAALQGTGTGQPREPGPPGMGLPLMWITDSSNKLSLENAFPPWEAE